MPGTTDRPSTTEGKGGAQAFRHLPEPVALEDTVTTVRGDRPPNPGDGRNAFIDLAIHAGG